MEREPWKCCGCGEEMHRDIGEQAQRDLDAANSKLGSPSAQLIHACSVCKTLHLLDGDKLRRLTALERLRAEVEMSDILDQMDRLDIKAKPCRSGTMIVGYKHQKRK